MDMDKKDEMRRTYIWGTGKIASILLEETSIRGEIDCVIDNDVSRQGKKWNGYSVVSPDFLVDNKEAIEIIVIASIDWRKIRQQVIEEYGIEEDKIDNMYFRQRKRLLWYYETHPDRLSQDMHGDMLYIRENPLDVFNASFVEKYWSIDYEVFFDEEKGLYYTRYLGKKLYFSRKVNTKRKAERYCRSMMLEQDTSSPHRYITDTFRVETGDVVMDAGVAEGNFALEIIDIASKVYLVEADPDWIEALGYTFAPYNDKVCIVEGFLGNGNGGEAQKEVTVDGIVGGGRLDFLKMDIEGMEIPAIAGGENTLRREAVKLDICAYHKAAGYEEIAGALEGYGYQCRPSDGFMVFITQENFMTLEEPRFVRGLLRGRRA